MTCICILGKVCYGQLESSTGINHGVYFVHKQEFWPALDAMRKFRAAVTRVRPRLVDKTVLYSRSDHADTVHPGSFSVAALTILM